MSNEKRVQQIRDAARYKYPDERIHFIDGAKWADQHPHWIPVEERLPEVDYCGNSDFYLVHDFGDSDHVAYYCKTDNEWYTETGESVFVTHWMEIVPPRKETNNKR